MFSCVVGVGDNTTHFSLSFKLAGTVLDEVSTQLVTLMKQKLEQRLQSLKAEFESGQKMLADLEAQQGNLRNTLLCISGAIQVLEEMLAQANEENEDNNFSPEVHPVLSTSD